MLAFLGDQQSGQRSALRILQSLTVLTILAASNLSVRAASLQPIRVSDNHRYFAKADGTPFFWLGDTAWSIFNHAKPEDVDLYLTDRASKGFTVIQGCVVLWDGLRRANADGQLPFVDGDPSQINEAFFKNVDSVVDKAEAHGLYMAILPFWTKGYIQNTQRYGQTMLNPVKLESYGRFLGKRYRDKPGIFWVLGGDWPGRDTAEMAAAMATGLREGDGGAHLITYHPTGRQSSSFWFQEAPWLDFNVLQSGHYINTTNFRLITDDWAKTPIKPTLDMEPGYENITDRLVRTNANARRILADDVRRSAYLAVFAGAAGHTYGNGEVYEFWSSTEGRPMPGWGASLDWHESLKLPGSGQLQHLRHLIESRPMLMRIPDQSLIVGEVSDRAVERVEATRGSDGSYAFIYTATGKPFTVVTGKLSGETIRASWFDPRTGVTKSIGDYSKAKSKEFTPPAGEGEADWVLVLDDASKNFTAPSAATAAVGKLAPRPLYRDPPFDAPTDPVLCFNAEQNKWFMYYTARRATATNAPGVTWIHGSSIGMAESSDGGATWTYRGTADISYRKDAHPDDFTYWAPEVIWVNGTYHMFLTYVPGIFNDWNHPREIVHLTSKDGVKWDTIGPVDLKSDRVIDACVMQLPDGRWRMWYKDERKPKALSYADSPDLDHWEAKGNAVTDYNGEGPKAFHWKGRYWLVADCWANGMRVWSSDDCLNWKSQDQVLIGSHGDVVVSSDRAWWFYFGGNRGPRGRGARPGPAGDTNAPPAATSLVTNAPAAQPPRGRTTAINVVELSVVDGHLVPGDPAQPTTIDLKSEREQER